MLQIETFAVFLLIARLISVAFMLVVLRLQWRIFGTEIDFTLVPNLTKYQKNRVYLVRKVLFVLSCIILLGNLVPIAIDIITIVGNNALSRNPFVPTVSIGYGLSNALTAMFSSITIWTMYKLSGLSTK